jgi:hypothetical protein
MSALASGFPLPPALDAPPLAMLRRSGRYRSIAFRRCEKDRDPMWRRDCIAMERMSASALTTPPSSDVSSVALRVSRWEMTSLASARPRKRFRTDCAASRCGFASHE